ncbi:siroheme synthase CysG [Catenovulum sp. 2E275]|uniref:siroheme synthase CysG n=1 Tax=Catenovulum sp. 2E275 TaxID=2980497 RepID=UPI0021D0DF48|nr:siroheme synthase CysG [Catenovulum sp. 2E275]MCU4677130.1 siroheme synthase CysG [Catenovulum sp. 2E275]
MEQFPIFLNLTNFPCAVIGGGDVAYRKASALIKAQAELTIIAPKICDELVELVQQHNINLIQKNYDSNLIKDMRLVVAATDDETVNAEIYQYCEANKILINTVDSPAYCRYTTPSIVDRSPILIAISSAGMSPVLARRIRATIESSLPQALGEIAQYAGSLRSRVKQKFKTIEQRRMFWENFFSSSIVSRFRQLKTEQKEQIVADLMNGETAQGEVWLVGAGPGDEELLTIKALQKMQLADVIVYDRLISQKTLDLARKDADFICVGKQKNYHLKQQEEINDLLVRLAKAGKKVCRLKGGDPFIFGRGGEELETLVQHQIPFQVIPAVTAAAGCASYAGIPLTHRDYARKVVFVTGQNSKEGDHPDWQALVRPYQTLVIYMGLTRADLIKTELINHGMDKNMPVAIVEKGTTPEQKVHITDLNGLPQLAEQNKVGSPALLIIGDVVKLAGKLNWFNPDEVEEGSSTFNTYIKP